MEDTVFPSDTCVLACSGPSLNSVDVFSLGLPVVAVSTAIRKIPKPNFWILADYLNEMHDDDGKLAYSDPTIIKVVPDNKITNNANPQSLVLCNYDTSTRWPDIEKHLFSGNQPFIRGPHKSVTFAIQWLHYIGVKRIIWTGNDLTATSMKGKYCYDVKDFDMKKEYNYHKTLDQTAEALRKWYPIALKRGFEWYSWECGSVFESFVPRFSLEWWEQEGKNKVNKNNLSIKLNDIPKIEKISEIKQRPPKKIPNKKIEEQKIEEIPQIVAIKHQQEPIKDPKEALLLNLEPPKEIISERRKIRQHQIEIKRNLRSL